MLSSQVKAIIRWVLILIVGLGYYFWLGIAYLPFGHISEKESVLLSGPISLELHQTILKSVMDATNTVYSAAFWGFLVCVSLILLIFSKVR